MVHVYIRDMLRIRAIHGFGYPDAFTAYQSSPFSSTVSAHLAIASQWLAGDVCFSGVRMLYCSALLSNFPKPSFLLQTSFGEAPANAILSPRPVLRRRLCVCKRMVIWDGDSCQCHLISMEGRCLCSRPWGGSKSVGQA